MLGFILAGPEFELLSRCSYDNPIWDVLVGNPGYRYCAGSDQCRTQFRKETMDSGRLLGCRDVFLRDVRRRLVMTGGDEWLSLVFEYFDEKE